MSKEDPYRDQAERLRKRIERKSESIVVEKNVKAKELPSRSQIHKHKRKKTKIKLKYPVIRILVMFFILLPITIFSVYSYFEKQDKGKVEKVSGDTGGYETIDLTEEDSSPEESEVVNTEDQDADQSVEDQSDAEDSPQDAAGSKVPLGAGDDKNTSAPVKEKTAKAEPKKKDAAESKAKPEEKKEEIIYHTVQASETLFRIAMKYYNSQAGIDIIKNANGIQNNEIQAGQVLKIPLNR